jgi:hypothetical protein
MLLRISLEDNYQTLDSAKTGAAQDANKKLRFGGVKKYINE